MHHNPTTLHDGIVTKDWRQVEFVKDSNPAGVPEVRQFLRQGNDHSLLTYESACALAWTILAQNPNAYCLECRLVEFECKMTYELERKALVDKVFSYTRHSEISTAPYPESNEAS